MLIIYSRVHTFISKFQHRFYADKVKVNTSFQLISRITKWRRTNMTRLMVVMALFSNNLWFLFSTDIVSLLSSVRRVPCSHCIPCIDIKKHFLKNKVNWCEIKDRILALLENIFQFGYLFRVCSMAPSGTQSKIFWCKTYLPTLSNICDNRLIFCSGKNGAYYIFLYMTWLSQVSVKLLAIGGQWAVFFVAVLFFLIRVCSYWL